MAISETKMQMVIANYFKDECDVNTSIRQAFEKGFRIGVKKGASVNRPQGEWIIHYRDKWMVRAECPKCHRRFEFSSRVIWKCCPMCETRMKGVYDEVR